MSFIYRQIAPILLHNGHVIPSAVLYSGHGIGLNNPNYEAMANVGCIPAGEWHIEQWFDIYEDKGPIVARLRPVGHDAHGRTGFLIHGPHANDHQDSSHGCIIASRNTREQLRALGDTSLVVVIQVEEFVGT